MKQSKTLWVWMFAFAASISLIWLAGCPAEGEDDTSNVPKKQPAEAHLGIIGDVDTLTIAVGGTAKLVLEGTQSLLDAAVWSSDNDGVATVAKSSTEDSATVTGVAQGEATVTVSADGKDVTVTVTVTAAPLPKTLHIDGQSLISKTEGDGTFTLTASGTAAVPGNLAWSSSDPSVASVAGSGTTGTVTVVGAGMAQITVMNSSESLSAAVTISVSDSETEVIVGNDVKDVTVQDNSDSPSAVPLLTDEHEYLAYALTTGGISIYGKPQGKNSWYRTSYVSSARGTRGWYYDLNGRGTAIAKASNGGTTGNDTNSPKAGANCMVDGLQVDPDNGVTLKVEPYLMYVDDVPYLLIVHTLSNPTSSTVSSQKFGACSDVQIGSEDNAKIAIDNEGVVLGPAGGLKLKLVCKTGESITPVSTLWIGNMKMAQNGGVHITSRVYENAASPSYTSIDSGFAFSYQNIDLAAGETKMFMVRFALLNE